jgi:RNA polymerase sigma factor (sigma-70 family)
MLEDKLLIWKLKRGDSAALRQVYEKYRNDLLALALALSNDRTVAEDAVHDVFVSFAQYAGQLELKRNLKNYLLACVANHVRNVNRSKQKQATLLDDATNAFADFSSPEQSIISAEVSRRIASAMERLPYEQQEVIILHLQSGMKFKTIAELQNVSINTIQSRYRYGIEKLRSILNSEV